MLIQSLITHIQKNKIIHYCNNNYNILQIYERDFSKNKKKIVTKIQKKNINYKDVQSQEGKLISKTHSHTSNKHFKNTKRSIRDNNQNMCKQKDIPKNQHGNQFEQLIWGYVFKLWEILISLQSHRKYI